MGVTVQDSRMMVDGALARSALRQRGLAAHLQLAVGRHRDNLVSLTAALQAAGRDDETIRRVVDRLVRAGEAGLR